METNNIEEARKFIASQKRNNLFRPKFHFTPTVGRICEPCAVTFIDKKFHLFYNINPFIEIFGPLYWGHAKTYNLYNFYEEPLSIAPDQIYDADGCRGGTAFVKDNKIFLLYTGVKDDYGEIIETQNIAFSKDYVNFTKSIENPVIASLPQSLNADNSIFRHPRIFEHGNVTYCVCASKIKDRPCLLLFKSNDLKEWVYVKKIISNKNIGTLWQFPCIFDTDDKRVCIMISSTDLNESKGFTQNGHATVYAFIDEKQFYGSYRDVIIKNFKIFDHGVDFSGPTIFKYQNSYACIGLLNSWYSKSMYTELNLQYSGCSSLPRMLTIKDDSIYQMPMQELTGAVYKRSSLSYEIGPKETVLSDVTGTSMHLVLVFNVKKNTKYFFKIFKKGDNYCLLSFDSKTCMLTVDRTNAKYEFIDHHQNPNQLDIKTFKIENIKPGDEMITDFYFDVTTIEMFINKGQYAASFLFFADKEDSDVTMSATSKTSIRILKEAITAKI
ncbi:MAG: GH32 C-terminal domain-containing protein [Bacilli bacterium]